MTTHPVPFDNRFLPEFFSEQELRIRAFAFESEAECPCRVSPLPPENGLSILEISWDRPLSSLEIVFPWMSYGENGILTYPLHAGFRIRNPEKALFTPCSCLRTPWKDRMLGILESGLLAPEDADRREIRYARNATMQFCTYESPERNCFFHAAFEDPDFEQTVFDIRAEKGRAGFELSCRKIFNRKVDSGTIRFVCGVLPGNWQTGADLYRKWFDTLRIGMAPCGLTYPGMICHYDLLWQNGDIHHRYTDLPMLGREAAALGFDTVMCAAWNRDGFDSGYPDFRPSPRLGTEEELKNAVAELHRNGQKIIFYINAYSFDRDSALFEPVGREGAVKRKDGSTMESRWGTRRLTTECMGSQVWRKVVEDNLDYVLNTLGADGVYMDQLNVCPPVCHDASHEHRFSAMKNNAEFLRAMRRRFGGKAILLSEWSYDIMGGYLDAQLIQTLWSHMLYAFPEMFRYTFPEAGVLDMVLPKPWPGEIFAYEEKYLYSVFDRLILMGAYLWCYDHAAERRPFHPVFRAGVAVLKRYAECFRMGRFLEREGISCPEGVDATRFLLPGRGSMYVAANRTGEPQSIRTPDGEFSLSAERYSVVFSRPDDNPIK